MESMQVSQLVLTQTPDELSMGMLALQIKGRAVEIVALSDPNSRIERIAQETQCWIKDHQPDQKLQQINQQRAKNGFGTFYLVLDQNKKYKFTAGVSAIKEETPEKIQQYVTEKSKLFGEQANEKAKNITQRLAEPQCFMCNAYFPKTDNVKNVLASGNHAITLVANWDPEDESVAQEALALFLTVRDEVFQKNIVTLAGNRVEITSPLILSSGAVEASRECASSQWRWVETGVRADAESNGGIEEIAVYETTREEIKQFSYQQRGSEEVLLNVFDGDGKQLYTQLCNWNKIAERVGKRGFYDNCPVPLSRLCEVEVNFINFEGFQCQGSITVLDAVAPKVQQIFSEIAERQFLLAKMQPIERYFQKRDWEMTDEVDLRSMRDNNSCSFQNRPVTGGGRTSLHAFGLAIDINPIQNPYFKIDETAGSITVIPPEGSNYVNRNNNRPGKSYRPGLAEEVADIFSNHGFTIWGGNWDTPIDYQHFQTSRSVAALLTRMPSEEASQFFQQHAAYFRFYQKEIVDALKEKTNQDPVKYYETNRSEFQQHVIHLCQDIT